MQVKKEQLVPDMEQQTDSKSGKEYVKAIYCHPAYLIYMHSGILLSHKKEDIWISSNEVDEPRTYYTVKWVRRER